MLLLEALDRQKSSEHRGTEHGIFVLFNRRQHFFVLEMQDMRNCYGGLISAATSTTNSSYEFSESLRDLGSCLLEETILCNDEESDLNQTVLRRKMYGSCVDHMV